MKRIPLTQGKDALVDDKDFGVLNQYNWYTRKHRNTFYAQRKTKRINGKNEIILMHAQIIKTPKGMATDHRDNDGLNNQRKNLRVCSNAENLMNRGKPSNNTSGYKGVSFYKPTKKWRAYISKNGKIISLGHHTSKQDASEAYIKACKKYHGEFANY